MSSETKIKTQKGIVGSFDILGYSSFLENNEPEVAAEIVQKHLLTLRDDLILKHDKTFEGMPTLWFCEAMSEMNWLIFSDTILLTTPYRDSDEATEMLNRWTTFLFNAITMCRHMFDNGLPLRGSIAFGDYFVKDNCFAGRPIIEAYKTVQNMELACTALSESAVLESDSVLKLSKLSLGLSWALADYLVPLKYSKEARLKVLLPSYETCPKLSTTDLRQAVAESFWKHNKELSASALQKLNNTEMMFRFFQMKSPDFFDGPKKVKTDGKKA